MCHTYVQYKQNYCVIICIPNTHSTFWVFIPIPFRNNYTIYSYIRFSWYPTLGYLFTWMDPRYSHAQHSLSSSDFKIIINITNPPTSFVNILSSFVVIPSWKNSQVVRPCLFSTNYHCSSQYLYWTIFFCWIMFSVWSKMWRYCFLQNKQSSIFLVCWNVHCSISHVKSRCFTKRCWNIYHW